MVHDDLRHPDTSTQAELHPGLETPRVVKHLLYWTMAWSGREGEVFGRVELVENQLRGKTVHGLKIENDINGDSIMGFRAK